MALLARKRDQTGDWRPPDTEGVIIPEQGGLLVVSNGAQSPFMAVFLRCKFNCMIYIVNIT